LVGVTKTHPPDAVRSALAAGLTHFGENRVQEAEEKIATLADERARVRWHLIGHLQRNKARKAAALFDVVQSVDSLRLAEVLDRAAAETRRHETADKETRGQGDMVPTSLSPCLPVLLQVNV